MGSGSFFSNLMASVTAVGDEGARAAGARIMKEVTGAVQLISSQGEQLSTSALTTMLAQLPALPNGAASLDNVQSTVGIPALKSDREIG